MKNLSLAIFYLFIFASFPNQNAFCSSTNIIIQPIENVLPPASRIMKLKRTLLRNLWMDELIDSKKEFVKMELPEGKIIVNGQVLEGKLFKKYESILLNFEVTHGEKRAIHISKRFIKVGDFYGDCFRGEASGKMKLKFCDDDKNSSKSIF